MAARSAGIVIRTGRGVCCVRIQQRPLLVATNQWGPQKAGVFVVYAYNKDPCLLQPISGARRRQGCLLCAHTTNTPACCNQSVGPAEGRGVCCVRILRRAFSHRTLRPAACIIMAPRSIMITLKELESMRIICDAQGQRPLSNSYPTYVHLIAPLQGHHAAVQLKLTPFKPPQFPKQTLFSPYYRYTQCCQKISLQRCVETAVQTILHAFYQIGRWNLSDRDW